MDFTSPNEQAGIDWWNALTEQDRRFWMQAAASAVPADAWAEFQRVHAETHPGEVRQP